MDGHERSTDYLLQIDAIHLLNEDGNWNWESETGGEK